MRPAKLSVRYSQVTQTEKLPMYNTQPILNVPMPLLAVRRHDWLDEVTDFVNDQLDNPQLSVAMVAEQFDLSARQFQRRIRAASGESPAEFIRNRRLDQAHDHLTNQRYHTIKETSVAVGFQDRRYFSEQFHKRFGCLPSEIAP